MSPDYAPRVVGAETAVHSRRCPQSSRAAHVQQIGRQRAAFATRSAAAVSFADRDDERMKLIKELRLRAEGFC